MTPRYAQGAGPTRARTLRENRRTAVRIRPVIVDTPDEGLPFGDPRSFPGSVERFRWLAQRWLSRGAS